MAKILYFAQLVDLLGRASEEVTLPDSARDVRGLLTWLRSRGGNWERLLVEDVSQPEGAQSNPRCGARRC